MMVCIEIVGGRGLFQHTTPTWFNHVAGRTVEVSVSTSAISRHGSRTTGQQAQSPLLLFQFNGRAHTSQVLPHKGPGDGRVPSIQQILVQ